MDTDGLHEWIGWCVYPLCAIVCDSHASRIVYGQKRVFNFQILSHVHTYKRSKCTLDSRGRDTLLPHIGQWMYS